VLVDAAGGLLLFALVVKLGMVVGLLRIEGFDVGVYRRYGEAMAAGSVPYRDFRVEYPPGSLPLFLAPALVTRTASAYRHVFEAEMSGVLLALLVVVRLVLVERRRALAVIGATALAFGLLGSVTLIRFDLAAALLTAVAVVAVLRRHASIGGLALGAAIATKGYPLALLPIMGIHVARDIGLRAARVACSLAAATVAAVYAPFVTVAPHGVKWSIDAQLFRPLEIESLGGVVYGLAHKLLRSPLESGVYSFSGRPADTVGTVSAIVGCGALVAIWLRFLRSPADARAFTLACAACVAVVIGFSKVFSPQYLLWLIPLVVMIPGRNRAALTGLVATCALTAAVFPRHWEGLRSLHWTPLLVELARDLLVLALAALLTVSVRPRPQVHTPCSNGR
jgi:uncharacterized membrane protein